MTKAHEKLNYVEFAARDLAATKVFIAALSSIVFCDRAPLSCPPPQAY